MLRIIRRTKEKLMCPLVSAIIQITFLYIAFFQFFEVKDHYYSSISNAAIKKKIEEKIDYCGVDSWISWIVLDGNKSKNKYYFQDVIGCNPESKLNNSCSYSVKETRLNPFYNETYHKIDAETYSFLEKMDTGLVAYFDDLKYLKQFKSIDIALQSSNKEIKNIGLTVTKNIKKNIVYVFAMTNTGNNKCGKDKTISMLEELSLYAKEKL
jgi:hypothetical protein